METQTERRTVTHRASEKCVSSAQKENAQHQHLQRIYNKISACGGYSDYARCSALHCISK